MKKFLQAGAVMDLRLLLATLCLAGALPATPVLGGEGLMWRKERNEVDAEIEAWSLPRVLDAIAAATGWQVFVDPEARYTVSTRFQRLKPAEALGRLLGDLNFALLPQTNGPARLFVYRISVQDATQLIQPRPVGHAGKPIPNELIVTLKSGASIEELAKRLGGKVTGRIGELNAYRLQFEDEAAAKNARSQLENEADLSSTDYNFVIDRPARIDPLAMSSAPPLSLKPNASGASDRIIIGLIDTAVQAQGAGLKDFLLPGISLFGNEAPAPDRITHGTSMAETILRGLARGPQSADGTPVRLLPVDVYGYSENTTMFDVARGVYAAMNGGATIINLSLGGQVDSPFLHQLIQEAHRQGVSFVAASGNQPVTSPFYPAAYPEVLAVTAGDRNGRIAPYANRGDFVDAVAPGMNIVYLGEQAYLVTGTSPATANISGLLAGLISSGKTAAEARAEILRVMGFQPPAGK
jgi:hypothetical protein